MHPLFIATFLTLVIYLMDSLNKCKRQLWFYFVLFLFVAGMNYLLLGKAEAKEIHDEEFMSMLRTHDEEYTNVLRAGIFNGQYPLDDDDKHKHKTDKSNHKKSSMEKIFREKIKYHLKQGEESYKEAKNRCALIPQRDNFDKAMWCFHSILASIPPGTPASRLISGIIVLGGQYCVAVINEWNMIENALLRAEYHFNLMEFYEDMLSIEFGDGKSTFTIKG